MADKEYETLLANVRTVLTTTAGQEVVWEIISMCGVYTDNHNVAHQGIEGKRAVGLEIIALLMEADPKAYPNLMITKQEQEDVRDRNNSN